MSTPLMTEPAVVFLDRGYVGIVYGFGRKYIHAIELGSPIKLIELERDAQLRLVMHDGLPYPVRRAAKIALKSAHPINDAARDVLRKLKAGEKT